MSYLEEKFYSVACDHPGCGNTYDEYGDGEWYGNKGDADTHSVEYGWQVIHDGDSVRHYCPEHHHAECRQCDAKETGSPTQLKKEGWVYDDEGTVVSCPECAASGE